MEQLNGFPAYFFSPLSLANMSGMARVLGELLTSANLYFWFLVLLLLRFVLPDILLWLTSVFYPRALIARQGPGLPENPLVSIVIAGRNVEHSIAKMIQSALQCGYHNLEVIFVDDFSADGSVARARAWEKTGRVRVFEARNHNGKPGSLNIGLTLARGDYIFIPDADCELQPGIIQHLLAPFADAKVGAVSANLRVRNAARNWVTRFQECEYALNVSISRLWRAPLNMLSILPGAGSMFRTVAMRQLGGYDSGLGDDTDLTLRLRKQGWKLRFALDAIVWTDVPGHYGWLLRQRSRWSRNMIKIRLHKQGDLYHFWRFGWVNALVFGDVLIFRVILPFLALWGVVYFILTDPFSTPALLTVVYWLTTFFLFIKLLIAHDIAATPRLKMLWLAPLYPFYRLPIHLVELLSMLREFLRIRLWHPYVPERIWARIPHW
ncbi:MAG: glycosyltransferase family 2 protein [Sulfuricella sp.]|jgi:cellulose synthase/poly-beta-1,6-N-acetylglucosamine synthase-like glycosyltransferase